MSSNPGEIAARHDNVSNSFMSTFKYEEKDSTYYIEFATQVKTNQVNKTLKIIDNNTVDTIILHFALNEISSFELLDNMVSIYTCDEVPTVIRFSSNADAEEASDRINRMINGEFIS